MNTVTTRMALPTDVPRIRRIYNAGIKERVATFETRPRDVAAVRRWLNGRHPVVVAERDGEIAAFAATFPYRERDCYRGVAEHSVYVDARFRGRGIGGITLRSLIAAAADAGFWKLVSRIFPENEASRRLHRSIGFREVGGYRHHARLDGVWRDVVIVEYLIEENRNAE